MSKLNFNKESAAYGALIASKRFLTKTEVAIRYGCSETVVDEMRSELSETRFTKGRPLFDAEEIDAMLESRKVK